MAFRSLLVHLDDSERCSHRLGVATRVAHEFTAQLVGVYLVPTPELTPTIAALLPESVVKQRLRVTGEAQDLAEARFCETSQRANLVAIEWRAPAGDPVDAIAAHTRGADLAIVGQPHPGDFDAAFVGELANAAVLYGGRPVLIVPHSGAVGAVGKTVFVAWNDSKESARAVADALSILAKAKQVIVMSINTSDDEGRSEGHGVAHIDAYLRRHRVVAAVRHIDDADADVGELLLAQAQGVGADLMVMGAYGHTALRERMLGGVTRTILTKATMPVLMSH